MAELIDISNEKFWDILFDEACVEGQQAKRIETALKQIATTESEIRAKAIDEYMNAVIDRLPSGKDEQVSKMACVRDMIFLLEEVAERLKEE